MHGSSNSKYIYYETNHLSKDIKCINYIFYHSSIILFNRNNLLIMTIDEKREMYTFMLDNGYTSDDIKLAMDDIVPINE